MKNLLSAEIESLNSIKSCADLYRLFFRGVQLFSAIGLVYLLVVVLPLLSRLSGQEALAPFLGPALIVGPCVLCCGQFILAELALRAVNRGQVWGTVGGLILSALLISRWYFPLAGFGFFCFLNPGFQRTHLGNAPGIFREILSALRLNWTDPPAVKSEADGQV